MENAFYELIKMNFFIGDGQDIHFRKPAEKGPGFKSRRIVIIRVQGAVDLMQMVMAQIIVENDRRAEEENEGEKEGRAKKPFCSLDHNYLFIKRLSTSLL